MRFILLAGASINTTPLDWDGNKSLIRGAFGEAEMQGIRTLFFQELVISGYGCEDQFYSRDVTDRSMRILLELAKEARHFVAFLGLAVRFGGALWNCVAAVHNGKILAIIPKQHLAGEGVYYEGRWFKAWPKGLRQTMTIEGIEAPIGDYGLDVNGVLFGAEICESAWVRERPGIFLAGRNCDVVFNPSMSHSVLGKHVVREQIVCEGSRAYQCIYVYVTGHGNESGRLIFDGDNMVADSGTLVTRGKRYSYFPVQLTPAWVDIEKRRTAVVATASFEPDLTRDDFWVRVSVEFPLTIARPPAEPTKLEVEPWERSPDVQHEEYVRMQALGLFDYLRKSRARGLVVSLSGGVDSSVTVVHAAYMIKFGIAELGLEGFKQALSQLEGLADLTSEAELAHRIIKAVYQRLPGSTLDTEESAASVANWANCEFKVIDVTDVYQALRRHTEELLGRKLDWANKADRITLQNLKARARSGAPWGWANGGGGLLLTTSNLSEALVGYCTMDGDTSGGYNLLGGRRKSRLITWGRWMVKTGPHGFGPCAGLSIPVSLTPSAELDELVGGKQEQTDEKELAPYPILDQIEEWMIGSHLSAMEVFLLLEAQFGSWSDVERTRWVYRVYQLFSYNQWKRERYAAAPNIEAHNLDPRSWMRFPILNGGFRTELRELRAYVLEHHGAEAAAVIPEGI